MSRYIDADALKRRLYASPAFFHFGEDGLFIRDTVLDIIEKFPTSIPTANVVEVVRCRDCKHYKNEECIYHSEPKEQRMYERWTVDFDEDDYCSYGERREENEG